MTLWLKQSTSASLMVGPAVSTSDGYTALSALSFAASDMRLSKNGAAFGNMNSGSLPTHAGHGRYALVLDTTDTNTAGRLLISCCANASALPFWHEFMVVAGSLYDSLILGTSYFQSGLAASPIAEVWTNATRSLTASGIVASTLAESATSRLADTVLVRDWELVAEGAASRSALNAQRFLRNAWTLAGSTLTVYKEDDSTQAWSASVTTVATANPITGTNPAN